MSGQNPGTSAQTTRIDMVHSPSHTYEPYAKYHNKSIHHGVTNSAVKTDFAYVNAAYVGSSHSVNENRLQGPPVSVIREQYWACSKWPFATRLLAIAVGVLLGAVISLSILMAMKGEDTDVTNMFRSHTAPD